MPKFAPKSVRTRLALGNSLALSAALVIYSLSLYFLFKNSAYNEFDVKLRNDLEAADDALLEAVGPAARPLSHDAENWLTEVFTQSGQRVLTTGAPDEKPLGDFDPRCLERYDAFDAISTAGLELRVFCQQSSTARGRYVLRVARGRERIENQLRQFRLAALLGTPAVVLLSLAFGYLLARRALRPVSRLTEAARGVTASRLGERLPVHNPDDELGKLAETFNAVFQNLERSFHQMRRFSSDASHELRTPLTAIRALGEVTLRGRGNGVERRDPYESIASILEETDRLQSLCESLLVLSRADAGQVALQPASVPVRQLLWEVVDILGILAEEKGQTISMEAPEGLEGDFDRGLLKQALMNLVDNAIKHCPGGATIKITAETRGTWLTLRVADDGPGIAPEHLPHIFERFYRADSARRRAEGQGVGLGLAIAAWAVGLHDGKISVDSEAGRGSRFVIDLPLTESKHHGSQA